MPRRALEDLAARWVPGGGPVDVRPLTAGIVNESYRVARAGRLYCLRVATRDARDLGLDREWECRVLKGAAAARLAPAIARCEPDEGILVAEWVDGRAWTALELKEPSKLRAVAALLRGVHALPIPQPPRVMSPGDWIAHYAESLVRRGAHLSPAAARYRGAADACVAQLQKTGTAPRVLCHSDVHRCNVAQGARPVLLDWEYAHVSDPFWDLAGWTQNNDGSADFAARLLAEYLERPAAHADGLRLELLQWLYDYVCLLWSELYLSQRGDAPDRAVSARAETLAARLAAKSW